jgi:hypothetical protein
MGCSRFFYGASLYQVGAVHYAQTHAYDSRRAPVTLLFWLPPVRGGNQKKKEVYLGTVLSFT